MVISNSFQGESSAFSNVPLASEHLQGNLDVGAILGGYVVLEQAGAVHWEGWGHGEAGCLGKLKVFVLEGRLPPGSVRTTRSVT